MVTVLGCMTSIQVRGVDLYRLVQTVVISSIKLQTEQATASQPRGIAREGPYLQRYQPQPLSAANGIVLHPRLCITIDLWDSLTPAGEPSDLIKGSFLTHLQHNNIKMGKFRRIANK